MISLALKNLTRRKLRSGLTLFGVAIAVSVLASLLAFGEGYERSLKIELERMGVQMMLVPLGCPYDAASKVLKGKSLDVSLPDSALDIARKDPATACASPMLMATLPRPSEGRADLWAGIDASILALKPWWKMRSGTSRFPDANSVLLGAEAASTEFRRTGDTLYSPETGRRFKVCGILERSGTSDDSMFFIPLKTAQAMFHQERRLTAIAIRLKDPALITESSARLQRIPGAQVTTFAEMMGAFLNLVGSVRTLVMAITILAILISGLLTFNTMLASVLERTREIGMMRAVGASQGQMFFLLILEAFTLTFLGSSIGILLSIAVGSGVELMMKRLIPLTPNGSLIALTPFIVAQCFLVGIGMGCVAGLYPAWQASRLRPAEATR